MSLTTAANIAQLGLAQTQSKIAVVAANINNADRAGYTRKTYESQYINVGQYTVPVAGKSVTAVADPLLAKQANNQLTVYTAQSTISSYLSEYSATFGGTGPTAVTIGTSLSDLSTALQALEANPQTTAARSQVVSVAQQLANQLSQLSKGLQDQRLKADNDMSSVVSSINENLVAINALNKQISIAGPAGQSTADLEDQRNLALQSLSGQIGVQYFTNENNQTVVYTNAGTQLIGPIGLNTMDYDPLGAVNRDVTFNPITVNGKDITSEIKAGKLGALMNVRDNILPAEQDKLDTLAGNLQNSVNAVLSKGTAVPASNKLTSSTIVTSGTAFGATGNLRVAVTDKSGNVTSFADLNLSSYATVGALVTALNGISGVNASISSTGHLEILSTDSTRGIALNTLNSDVGGKNASQFFGFNDLFVNPADSGAYGLRVNPVLIADNAALATGTLASGSIAVGDRVLSTGDISNTTALINMLNTAQTFAPSGNFASRNATLANYAAAIIADSAVQAKSAKTNADTAGTAYNYLSTTLANETGVNVDEETANLTALQTTYQANAQIISTVRSMFDSLLQAVR